MQYMQKKNYNGRDAIKNTKYDVFNIIRTCRPLELGEQKTFIYAEITIMKTLLKLKYKSFVQIYLSFELWEKSVKKVKKREKEKLVKF